MFLAPRLLNFRSRHTLCSFLSLSFFSTIPIPPRHVLRILNPLRSPPRCFSPYVDVVPLDMAAQLRTFPFGVPFLTLGAKCDFPPTRSPL